MDVNSTIVSVDPTVLDMFFSYITAPDHAQSFVQALRPYLIDDVVNWFTGLFCGGLAAIGVLRGLDL